MSLPPLAVDEEALELYWAALHPADYGGERTTLHAVLAMHTWTEGGTGAEDDPKYHPNDLISALITEIRRLRDTG